MEVEVSFSPRLRNSRGGLTETTIISRGTTTRECRLGLDVQGVVRALGAPTPSELDLLLVSAAVYAIDKLVLRAESADNWCRTLNARIPVADPSLWEDARPTLERALCFLTGDQWRLVFATRGRILRSGRRSRNSRRVVHQQLSSGSLFSGGLDSLSGAIDFLESSQGTLLCISHHDRAGGDNQAQTRLTRHLRAAYPGRFRRVGVYCGIDTGATTASTETSLRSRSFLFLGLGSYCCNRAGLTELLMPENGVISVNPPLTPGRRGSCSTRTAHPYFVGLFNEVLQTLGFRVSVRNPYETKTKGEVLSECRNRDLLVQASPDSVSCGKTGRFRTWSVRKVGVNACGACVPCLYRRAALHAIGVDTQAYGNDVTAGEVDASSCADSALDLRDMVTFVRSDDAAKTARDLVSGGVLDIGRLHDYVDLVQRGKTEVRTWLRERSTAQLAEAWKI